MITLYSFLLIFVFLFISCSSENDVKNGAKVKNSTTSKPKSESIAKVSPVDLSVSVGGKIKLKIKNENQFIIELRSIKIFNEGNIHQEIIEPGALSREYDLMRYALKDLKVGEQYKFKIAIYFTDLSDINNEKQHGSVEIVSGEVVN